MRAFSLGSANRPFIWEGNLNDVIENERCGMSMLEMEETICLQLLCEPAPSTLVTVKVHYRVRAAIEVGVFSKDLDASSTSSTTHVPTKPEDRWVALVPDASNQRACRGEGPPKNRLIAFFLLEAVEKDVEEAEVVLMSHRHWPDVLTTPSTELTESGSPGNSSDDERGSFASESDAT